MPGSCPHPDRSLTALHETDPMMDNHSIEVKFSGRFAPDFVELVRSHLQVSFISDARDFATVFEGSDQTQEIEHRPATGSSIR